MLKSFLIGPDMSDFDLDNLTLREMYSFTDIDLKKDKDEKLLADGNIISAKIENGQPKEYAVKGPNGNLLRALYLQVQPEVIGERKCQVCYTTQGGAYICVNVLCNGGVVVQTVNG